MPLQLHVVKFSRWDRHELDKIARAARRTAGIEPEETFLACRLIQALLGRSAYGERSKLGTRAALVRRGWFIRILVRKGELDINFLAAHELAHYLLREEGFQGPKDLEEDYANYLAAALLVSPEALSRIYGRVGEDLQKIAALFQTTQTLIHRRLAEVRGDIRGIIRAEGTGAIEVYNHIPTADEIVFLRHCVVEKKWPDIVKVYPMQGSRYDAGRTGFLIVA